MSDAERQRRRRQRQAEGTVVVRLEVSEDHSDALEGRGFLPPSAGLAARRSSDVRLAVLTCLDSALDCEPPGSTVADDEITLRLSLNDRHLNTLEAYGFSHGLDLGTSEGAALSVRRLIEFVADSSSRYYRVTRDRPRLLREIRST